MKRLLAKSILLAGGMTVSSQLLALGLGEMNLDSALNQPLRADIELIDTAGLSAAEMKPKLASAIDFERAGVERYQFLTQMKFSVNGDRIVVTTRDPINEPFLNFLVELNWPSGRVLREYTVLLDPPVFEEGRVQPLVAVPAGAITSTASVTTQPQAASVPAQKPASANKWNQPAAPGEYKVQPDDTLWQIALETRPNRSISPQQMMVALQDVNPDAFINGNINRLKTHTTLIVPDESIIQTISGQEAVVEVQRQNRELTTATTAQIDATGRSTETTGPRKTSGGGEVRLLSAKADGQSNQAGGSVSGATGSTSTTEDDLSIALENLDKSQRENQELVDRLTALEEQLAKMERLITLQNDQLASMSAGVAAEKSAAEAVVEAPVETGKTESAVVETSEVSTPDVAVVADAAEQAQPATEETTAAESTEGQAEEGEAAASAESAETDYNYADSESAQATEEAALLAKKTEQEAAVLAMQKRAAEEARKAEAAAKSPLDTIIDTVVKTPIEYIAVGLGLLLSLIAGLLMLRKRKKDEEEAFDEVMADDSIASDIDNTDDLNNFELPEGAEEQSAFGNDLDNADDTLVEHGDLGELPVSDDLDDLDLDGYDDNDADQYETVGQTEDAISESDIYIAYGKFDQALELLNSAIDAEPERVDLRLKHLEILASLDNSEDFSQAEGNLNALGNEDANRQAEELRAQLSNPIAPIASSNDESALSLDGDIPSLDESAESEFDDGMDFGEALDFGDDVVPEDDGIGSSLEEVPELELGETSDFDANAEGVDMSLEDDAMKVDENLLAFDLDDDEDDLDKIDAVETDLVVDSNDDKEESEESDLVAFNFDSETEAEDTKSDEPALDLDGELEELSFELPQEDAADADSLDLDVASETVKTDLEELAESADDKLDFEAEPVAGANDALDDLLDTDDIDLELADGELQIDLPENDIDEAAEPEISALSLDDDGSDDALDLGDLAEVESPELDESTSLDLGDLAEVESPELDESTSLDLDNLETDSELDISALDLDADAVLDVEDDVSLDVEDTSIDLSELEETSAELEDALPDVDLGDAPSIAALTDVADVVDSSSELVDSAAETESFESVVAGVAEEAIEEPLVAAGPDEDSFADLEDLMSTDAESLAENSDLIGGIDLDELAAADDEFDFLAGTDECATKLDLARAYVDMEDNDGARELLQEVIQEGNDEQKSEAKDMMDKLS